MFGFTRWRFARGVRRRVASVGLAALTACAGGCSSTGAGNECLTYPHSEPRQIESYIGEEMRVAHSNVCHNSPEDVSLAAAPRTIADRRNDVVRELSLGECIHIALINNKIVQTGVQAPVGQKGIFTNPDNIPSIYDQAIGETGVLFGRRGVEAALSDFDATLSSTMTWGRSSLPTNLAAAPGASNVSETWNYSTTLSKQFATGASLQFFQNLSYLGTNSDAALLPSSFSGNNGFQFRQPLLAGAGTEFTRIAGPVNPNFGAITGVSQGVLIARINSDISLTQFEAAVRNSIRDLQTAYWDLYLGYRNYETSVVAHRSAFQTWKEANIKLDVGTLKAADEAQAREQFYATQSTVEQNLNQLYKAETALRRLMGLQINDCEIIRPADTPMVGEFIPDWRAALAEGLTRRVELRRQKWNIKSLQLQLQAACSLTRPQLDLIGGATQNGLGNDLLGDNDSAINNIWGRDNGSWNFGVEYSVPLGFRSAHSQVRNLELRVAKAMAVLDQTEREVVHDVTTAIQDLIANYTSAETTEERLIAAKRRAELLDLEREEGTTTLDLVLRAQAALAQAESQYHTRVVDFTKAMIDFEFSKGSLLPGSGVQLAEGGWDTCAYQDALRRAMERTYAYQNDHLEQRPPAFARSQPVPITPVDPMICDEDGFEIVNPQGEDEFRFAPDNDWDYEELPRPDGVEIGDDGFPVETAPDTPDFEPAEAPSINGNDFEPADDFGSLRRTEPRLSPQRLEPQEMLPIDTTWLDVERQQITPPVAPVPQRPKAFLDVSASQKRVGGFGKAGPGLRRATRTRVTPSLQRAKARSVQQQQTRQRAIRAGNTDAHFSADSLNSGNAGWKSLPGPFYPVSGRRTLDESMNKIHSGKSSSPVKFGDLFQGASSKE